MERVTTARIIQSQHAGGMLLPPVQKLVATFIFRLKRKMQTSLVTRSKQYILLWVVSFEITPFLFSPIFQISIYRTVGVDVSISPYNFSFYKNNVSYFRQNGKK